MKNFKFKTPHTKSVSNRWKLVILIFILLLSTILRFYKLDSNPPGLYWDEAAFGYNAYTLSQTGRDEHGRSLPLFFESFGDWKLPGYFYFLIPWVKAFGLSQFAVRIPAALSGSLTVLIFFFLIKKLTKNINLSLFCTLFLAISPWHIQFSRGGFESTVGLLFVTAGLYLTLFSIEKKDFFRFCVAAILFVLSIYTYHAYRIFTPLLVLSLILLNRQFFRKNLKSLFFLGLIVLVLTIPILRFTLSPEGKSRAVSESAFKKSDLETAKIDFDQKSKKPLRFLSRYAFQAPVVYSQIAMKNYIDHFSPTFLFIQGDQIGRHSQVDMGQIYIFEAILILFSLFALRKSHKILIIWLILAPLPATIVTPTPHAYRTLQMVIPLAFLSGLGAYHFFLIKKFPLIIKIILTLTIVYSFLIFSHLLFIHYPKKFAADWQDGYRQMVQEIKKYQDNYEKIYITNINSVPYIYLLFFQSYNPTNFFKENGNNDHFGKYYFIAKEEDVYTKGKILYVAPSYQKVDGKLLSIVEDSSSRHIYSLWEIGGEN